MTNPAVGARPNSPLSTNQASLLTMAIPVAKNWRRMLRWPLAAGVLTTSVSLLMSSQYSATTTFTPEVTGTTKLPQGLIGLAGQFGLSAASLAPGNSPEFFAEVLKSEELLRSTLLSSFHAPGISDSADEASLLAILNVTDDSSEKAIAEGTRLLRKRVATEVNLRTGVVTLKVEMPHPVLAAEVANRMLELLNQFNLERRQSQSREERRFAGERLGQAERELRDAEAKYQQFLVGNRRYSDSPILAFEANRLERQVQLRQEIYVTLSRQYEEARIAEVRNTPLITVIDRAQPPHRKSSPRVALNLFMGVVMGLVVAATFSIVEEMLRTASREDPSSFSALVSYWQDAQKHLKLSLGRRRR